MCMHSVISLCEEVIPMDESDFIIRVNHWIKTERDIVLQEQGCSLFCALFYNGNNEQSKRIANLKTLHRHYVHCSWYRTGWAGSQSPCWSSSKVDFHTLALVTPHLVCVVGYCMSDPRPGAHPSTEEARMTRQGKQRGRERERERERESSSSYIMSPWWWKNKRLHLLFGAPFG